mgnify:FL=1
MCTGSARYGSGVYPDEPVGGYISVLSTDDDSNGNGWEDAECSFTLTAGDTFIVRVNTGSYGSEGRVTVVAPSGTSTTYGGFSSGVNAQTVATLTDAGSYTVYYEDTWGDGCNPSTYWGACYVQVSHTYVSGTTVPVSYTHLTLPTKA